MEELGDEAQPHVSGSFLPRQVTVNDSRTSQHQLLTEVRNESTHRIARTGHHSGCRSPAGCLAFRGLCCLIVPGCSSQTHTPLETETASGFEANRWLILLIQADGLVWHFRARANLTLPLRQSVPCPFTPPSWRQKPHQTVPLNDFYTNKMDSRKMNY